MGPELLIGPAPRGGVAFEDDVRRWVDWLYERHKDTEMGRAVFGPHSRVSGGRVELDYDIVRWMFLDTGPDNIMPQVYRINALKCEAGAVGAREGGAAKAAGLLREAEEMEVALFARDRPRGDAGPYPVG